MASHVGPDLVSSGLALDYDMSNTSKSWIGPPTTNSVSDSIVVFTPSPF